MQDGGHRGLYVDADEHGARQPVLDLRHRRVGWSSGWTRDEQTGQRAGLTVEVDPDLREELPGDGEITLAADVVMAIRRDGITLDRTIEQLADLLHLEDA